ncbi:DUF222 domain-containing protein [Arthrobacter sp. UYCu712]|uniref:HNH endonuclease signature motif containing protein n=1 Tax=Arthrobacter sp. UYCu712 TaxID=3156340 RepID=UPI003397A47E
MEAIADFTPDQAAQAVAHRGSGGLDSAMDGALGLLCDATTTAVADSALFGTKEAADFAGRVEELTCLAEYLQLIAAAAVDRARNQASTALSGSGAGAPAGWLTGWNTAESVPPDVVPGAAAPPEYVDDGYRSTAEFLRARLRISAAEARRRLSLVGAVLPRTGIGGRCLPAANEELAAAVAAGSIASRAATVIALSLDRVRQRVPPETAARMEHALTLTAIENDHDFLTRIAKRWTDALDQDGDEPGETELRQRQGAFIRQDRRGLHYLEIFATTDQFEHLITVMNVATNPRIDKGGAAADQTGATADDAGAAGPEGDDQEAPGFREEPGAEQLHQRSRPQRLLDGLVSACKAALAAGGLPATGGLRPQVMVTIDYRHLLDQLEGAAPDTGGPGSNVGMLMFAGPVTASTVRKTACDADVIPVLLGGEGRILDIGRASRLFPPHVRKALSARDGGCAFPQCTVPAPWCEAHHIDYWSRGGRTGAGNGALLCSHHHHLIHKEQWVIEIRGGVPGSSRRHMWTRAGTATSGSNDARRRSRCQFAPAAGSPFRTASTSTRWIRAR